MYIWSQACELQGRGAGRSRRRPCGRGDGDNTMLYDIVLYYADIIMITVITIIMIMSTCIT